MTLPAPQDVWNGLPESARQLLLRLRQLVGPQARLALVGGAVRDLLLGQASASPDLDIVLAGGDVQKVVERLAVPAVWHPAYGNATLRLPEGLDADLVSARRERYPVAGGPPTPFPGSLEDDLARRDFSVNAAALEILAGGILAGGNVRLLSVPGMPEDLRTRQLRPLHALSFHDDASRLVRGARLAARLDLHAHPELLAQVPSALEVAPHTPRLAAELRLLLGEPLPGRAARALDDWGAASLLPAGAADLMERLDALPGPKNRALYAAALLSLYAAPDQSGTLDFESFGLGQRPADLLGRARSGQPGAMGSAEATLQTLLGLTLPYPPLQGRDLLEMGLQAGPEVGRVLSWLAARRREGEFASTQDERSAVLAHLKT